MPTRGAAGEAQPRYAEELAELHDLYARRVSQGRGSDDLAAISRAATLGAVDTAFVDIANDALEDVGGIDFVVESDGRRPQPDRATQPKDDHPHSPRRLIGRRDKGHALFSSTRPKTCGGAPGRLPGGETSSSRRGAGE